MVFGHNINKYYLKYWYLYLIGFLSLLVVDYYGSIVPPKIIGAIVNDLTNATMTDVLLKGYIGQLLLSLVLCVVMRFLWRFAFFGASCLITHKMRHELFAKSLKLSQTFYSNNKVGGLMAYYTNDIEEIGESIGWGFMEMCDIIILTPSILYNMFKLNWVVTLFALIPLVLIGIGAAFIMRFMSNRFKARQDEYEKLSDYTTESISGIRVVKAFVKEAQEEADFEKENQVNYEVNMSFIKLQMIFHTVLDLLIWLAYLAIVGVGSYFVINNVGGKLGINIGTLTQFVAYFDTLIWPMFAVGEVINMASRGKASLTRYNYIIDCEIDLIDGEKTINPDEFTGNITFNHLTFSYPDGNKPALNDVSFEIKEGEFIGIIGKTGSSKTTLVNLLLRLYNVGPQEILIDGEDIMSYKIHDLREMIGYVPQDNFLYSTTIEDNIAFKTGEVRPDVVTRTAKIAGVHRDISEFPNQYRTVLGERGVSVSGGQKQRISIARALYNDPKILILDDALSAVDTKTEADILSFLKNERKNKTTILIAHRISSIKSADKIAVFDDGGVLSGFDTHENLLKNNSIYRETYNLQQLEEERQNG